MTSLHGFIYSMGERTRDEFSKALGVEPGDVGGAACCVSCVKHTASAIDKGMSSCTCGAPLCSMMLNPCCLKNAKTRKLVGVLKDCGIETDDFPRNKAFVNLIIKSYYRDSLGIGKKSTKIVVTKYSPSDISRITKKLTSKRDNVLGQKLVRLLEVGSSDFRIGPNGKYRFLADNICGFTCCYGGSNSMAAATIRYMQEAGVECSALDEAIDNFDRRWKEYVKSMIESAFRENPEDHNRLSSRSLDIQMRNAAAKPASMER